MFLERASKDPFCESLFSSARILILAVSLISKTRLNCAYRLARRREQGPSFLSTRACSIPAFLFLSPVTRFASYHRTTSEPPLFFSFFLFLVAFSLPRGTRRIVLRRVHSVPQRRRFLRIVRERAPARQIAEFASHSRRSSSLLGIRTEALSSISKSGYRFDGLFIASIRPRFFFSLRRLQQRGLVLFIHYGRGYIYRNLYFTRHSSVCYTPAKLESFN